MDPLWPGLTDDQWDELKVLLPAYKKPFRKAKRKGGRPRASDKKAFEALVWALGGGTLERLPPRFGSRRTACRRLHYWFPSIKLEAMWGRYIRHFSAADASAWRDALAGERRRPFWQELMIAQFRIEFHHLYR